MHLIYKNKTQLAVVFLLIAALTLSAFTGSACTASAETAIKITLDGKEIQCDVAPVIVDSRTLVPLRAVFEAMGATVGWVQSTRTASVTSGEKVVRVTIGSTTAYINSNPCTLDVPAQIIGDRTMIPVRFVSENLGFTVGWDNTTKTVVLKSPGAAAAASASTAAAAETAAETASENASIKAVTCTSGNSGKTTVIIRSDTSLTGRYTPQTISGPERYFIDFGESKLAGTVSAKVTNSNSASVVTAVRSSQYGKTTVRVVCDLTEKSTPSLTLSTDGTTLTLVFGPSSTAESTVTETASQSSASASGTNAADSASAASAAATDQSQSTAAAETVSESAASDEDTSTSSAAYTFDPMADGKILVCIDPGHGATTGGKRSPDETLMEWEFNRDVAYRLKAYLEAHGIETVMTVEQEDQTDPSLATRVKIANNSAADIFVSIHANAYTSDWTAAKGWEIYVYKKGGWAEKLAESIEDANEEGGLFDSIYDRGLKTANFYVIKNTVMPAVLIEHGFYTNIDEVELLKNSDYRETFALYNAQGICKFFDIPW